MTTRCRHPKVRAEGAPRSENATLRGSPRSSRGSHLRVTLARILIPVSHPIALPLRGDETLAGVLIRLHQRRDLVQGALVLGLDQHAGDDELAAVRVDVSNERQRGIDSIA